MLFAYCQLGSVGTLAKITDGIRQHTPYNPMREPIATGADHSQLLCTKYILGKLHERAVGRKKKSVNHDVRYCSWQQREEEHLGWRTVPQRPAGGDVVAIGDATKCGTRKNFTAPRLVPSVPSAPLPVRWRNHSFLQFFFGERGGKLGSAKPSAGKRAERDGSGRERTSTRRHKSCVGRREKGDEIDFAWHRC